LVSLGHWAGGSVFGDCISGDALAFSLIWVIFGVGRWTWRRIDVGLGFAFLLHQLGLLTALDSTRLLQALGVRLDTFGRRVYVGGVQEIPV